MFYLMHEATVDWEIDFYIFVIAAFLVHSQTNKIKSNLSLRAPFGVTSEIW